MSLSPGTCIPYWSCSSFPMLYGNRRKIVKSQSHLVRPPLTATQAYFGCEAMALPLASAFEAKLKD